jgi:putative tryptophan/tyrosine transport system ATP-binding protein
MLQLRSLRKIFRRSDGSEIVAIDALNASFAPGEFVVLIGPNGSGKSTLFDLITGRSRLDGGAIFFDGADITRVSPHIRAQYVGLVSQSRELGLPRAMTVEEILRLALESRGIHNRAAALNYARQQLESLNPRLPRLMKSQIWSLSGGEYQLVSLAVAQTLLEPPERAPKAAILLLDEHTSHLAPAASQHVLQATVSLSKMQGMLTIMATHDPYVATTVGNRQIVLRDGRLLYDLTGAERIVEPNELRARMVGDWERQQP